MKNEINNKVNNRKNNTSLCHTSKSEGKTNICGCGLHEKTTNSENTKQNSTHLCTTRSCKDK